MTSAKDMTIDEFCDLHRACREGRQWALDNCCSMADAWDKLPPEWLLWVATRHGVLTDKELRLSAVSSARSVQHLMEDPRSIAAIDIAEKHALGTATDEEMAAAWAAAVEAARAAARAAAWAAAVEATWAAGEAAWAAAVEAAVEAARAAARAAAREAAGAAAGAAAWAAAREAAWEAAEEAAAKWLRENTSPNFEARREDGMPHSCIRERDREVGPDA